MDLYSGYSPHSQTLRVIPAVPSDNIRRCVSPPILIGLRVRKHLDDETDWPDLSTSGVSNHILWYMFSQELMDT